MLLFAMRHTTSQHLDCDGMPTCYRDGLQNEALLSCMKATCQVRCFVPQSKVFHADQHSPPAIDRVQHLHEYPRKGCSLHLPLRVGGQLPPNQQWVLNSICGCCFLDITQHFQMLSNTRTLSRMPYKNQNVDKKSLRSQRLQYSAWNPLRSKKNLRTCIGPVVGPLALLQCHTWRLWSSATKTRCLKQSATAPACVSCTWQLVGFLHASKNGSWTIDWAWAFSMGLFFHGPPPLGHILRTFNPSRSNGNSFLWGHQRLLEVGGSKQALENITPSWLPFPPVKVPILQGRL